MKRGGITTLANYFVPTEYPALSRIRFYQTITVATENSSSSEKRAKRSIILYHLRRKNKKVTIILSLKTPFEIQKYPINIPEKVVNVASELSHPNVFAPPKT